MKKILLPLMVLVMCLGMIGCQEDTGNPNNPGNNLEGNLEDILERIYENAKVGESFKDFIREGVYTIEITAENVAYHLGKNGLDFEVAIASEPVWSTSAYSLVLIRVKEGADIEQIKNEIKNNVDPMKWICVGVDPSNIIVDNIGDVIMLLMTDNETQALYDAFLGLNA